MARVSDFFCQKNPSLKKNIVFLYKGVLASVSEFVLQRVQFFLFVVVDFCFCFFFFGGGGGGDVERGAAE